MLEPEDLYQNYINYGVGVINNEIDTANRLQLSVAEQQNDAYRILDVKNKFKDAYKKILTSKDEDEYNETVKKYNELVDEYKKTGVEPLDRKTTIQEAQKKKNEIYVRDAGDGFIELDIGGKDQTKFMNPEALMDPTTGTVIIDYRLIYSSNGYPNLLKEIGLVEKTNSQGIYEFFKSDTNEIISTREGFRKIADYLIQNNKSITITDKNKKDWHQILPDQVYPGKEQLDARAPIGKLVEPKSPTIHT